jgi:cell division protein FtsB
MKRYLPGILMVLSLSLIFGTALWLLRRQQLAHDEVARREEAAALALKSQIVELESSRASLQRAVSDLLAENSELKDAYDQAARAAPGSRPASAGRLRTGPLAVRSPRSGAEPAGSPAPAPAGGSVCADCALRYDDQLDVQVDVIELETKLGNTIAVGTAQVSKVGPPPQLLASGSFRSELSKSASLSRAPASSGWGAGPLGDCGGGGCSAGVLLAPPPFTLPLVGWRVESVVGGAAGGGGLRALGGAWVRW